MEVSFTVIFVLFLTNYNCSKKLNKPNNQLAKNTKKVLKI